MELRFKRVSSMLTNAYEEGEERRVGSVGFFKIGITWDK
jgi:hypothetical protein